MFKLIKPTRRDNVLIMISNICEVRGNSVSIFFQSVILFLVVLFAVPAHADMLVGAKIGHMKVDIPSSTDPTNVAVNMSYEFDSLLADLSLVGEINRSVSSGKTSQGDELKFQSDGIYIAWKTTRSIFVTLRGGIVQNKIITGNTLHRDDGILAGCGIGLVIGKTRLHIEYTSLAGDANFLSLGLEF